MQGTLAVFGFRLKLRDEIILRSATIDDLAILKYWDTQPHVITSDPDSDWNWEIELQKFPEWREQLIACYNGRPVGFMQIIDPAKEETQYWGSISDNLRAIDIWIGDQKDIGKGYGTQMMLLALERCFSDPSVKEVLIDPLASNVKAHRFCERIGFKFVREQWFGDDHCFVYHITREEWTKRES
jgi:aminoglycoside 6'-N-acetyltransferase